VAGRPLNPDPDFDPDFDENSAPCLRRAPSPAGRAGGLFLVAYSALGAGDRDNLGPSGTEVPAPCAPCGRGDAPGAAARRRDFSPSPGGAPRKNQASLARKSETPPMPAAFRLCKRPPFLILNFQFSLFPAGLFLVAYSALGAGDRDNLGSSGTEVPAPCPPCGRGNNARRSRKEEGLQSLARRSPPRASQVCLSQKSAFSGGERP